MVDPLDTIIVSMWANGATAGQIAKTVGYGRNMIMAKINTLCRIGSITDHLRHARTIAIEKRVEELERIRQGSSFTKQPEPISLKGCVTFFQLTSMSCRYIVKGNGMKDALYCGQPKVKHSYCDHHYRLCYVPKSDKDKLDAAT